MLSWVDRVPILMEEQPPPLSSAGNGVAVSTPQFQACAAKVVFNLPAGVPIPISRRWQSLSSPLLDFLLSLKTGGENALS